MRQLSNEELKKLEILTQNSIELTLLEPTRTGLEKSIMDATGPVRIYLKDRGLHDYEAQKQGPENKIQIAAFLINEEELTSSAASLYRPVTKKGDPRIWFKGLTAYVKANDIIGLFEFETKLYVLNLTRIDIQNLINSNLLNPLQELVSAIKKFSTVISDELLFLLRQIAARGPVPALLNADTAVGRTLETLLGIDINSSKKPDYKGIELKSYRDKRGNRKSLFGQVPDWSSSKFTSSAQILDHFGYKRGDDIKLYCTVSTITRNSQGLMLKIDNKINQLLENSDKADIGDFVVWGLELLHSRLLKKHNETFWIAADSQFFDGKEYFQYKKVEHTQTPIVSQFDILLQQGIITLDHLIKRKANGSLVEKGPLFKLRPNCLNLLFPPSKLYELI